MLRERPGTGSPIHQHVNKGTHYRKRAEGKDNIRQSRFSRAITADGAPGRAASLGGRSGLCHSSISQVGPSVSCKLHLSEADLAFVTSFRPCPANQLALSALQSSSKVQVTNTE